MMSMEERRKRGSRPTATRSETPVVRGIDPGIVGEVPPEEVGIRVVVSYKLVKAGAELAFGILLLSLGSAGVANDLRSIARAIRHHATEAWSLALADHIVRAVNARRVLIVAWASVCDGLFSGFEGWALHRRYFWSPWLIVIATSCMIPFEIVALTRHASVGRVGLLVVNAAIAIYLSSTTYARSGVLARLKHP